MRPEITKEIERFGAEPMKMTPDGFSIWVDLDDPKHLEHIERGWTGPTLARVDLYRGGKRCSVHISIHLDNQDRPIFRMNYVGKKKDVTRTVCARPWTEVSDV